MDQSFHYLLTACQGLFQRKVMTALSGTGLTVGQPKVLDFLGLHDGSVQKRIAAGCQIDPATLTGLLSRMEEKGLIERRSENGDRRSLHVYLTELGWEKQREVHRTLVQQEEELLSNLSEEQRKQLSELLLSLCGKMCDLEVLQ